jgi:bifunctional non-homologous end joining protein LigD
VPTDRTTLEIDGRAVRVSNLEKVLYPDDGTTKHDVIAHYLTVSEVILPQLAGRPLTRKRWPNGVTAEAFFEKNAPRGTPEWVRTVVLDSPGSGKGRETITYPIVDGLASLLWVANLAALELHVPQWTVGPRGAVRHPDRLVIDLDPGPPAGLPECVRVAVAVRERLEADGLTPVPVTSGSKGLQMYAPVSARQSGEVIRSYARRLAEALERDLPDLVVSRMTKALRPGKVLLDWSQNNPAKTTICPYSLRGRPQANVACPRSWAELEAPVPLRQVHRSELASRLEAHGDLAEPLLRRGPRVPTG